MTREFKKEWRLRSIEERQKKVLLIGAKFGDNEEEKRQDVSSTCWVRD